MINQLQQTACLIAAKSRNWICMQYLVSVGSSIAVKDEVCYLNDFFIIIIVLLLYYYCIIIVLLLYYYCIFNYVVTNTQTKYNMIRNKFDENRKQEKIYFK